MKISLTTKAAKSGIWFASLTSISQIVSWSFTLIVARVLMPEDYGLMAMAGFLTAYIELISELGIGSAIVQKKEINHEELSSVFWAAVFAGLVCSLIALCMAYPTAWIFGDMRIVPITCTISLLFLIGSASNVPFNILRRDFRFKEIGVVNIISMFVSSIAQIIMACKGFGVYTLIFGVIIVRLTKAISFFYISKWHPMMHYSYCEVRPFLKYGVNLAGSSSINRLIESIDKFIVGKLFNAEKLGSYGFAMTLASLPTDKIWPIFQQISFPLFSRFQDNRDELIVHFRRILSYLMFIVCPLFLGGAVFGEVLIISILGEKWIPIVFMFRVFCITKLFDTVSEFSSMLCLSTGKSHFVLLFSTIKFVVLPISIYISACYSFEALIIPWIMIYPILCIFWILYNNFVFRISLMDYFLSVYRPLIGTVLAIVVALIIHSIVGKLLVLKNVELLLTELCVFVATYIVYLLQFERKIFNELAVMIRNR